MSDELKPIIDLIPEKWRSSLLLAVALSPYVTRAIHALSNGRGIRGVVAAIWFGTNTPSPIPKAEIEKQKVEI